jgi:hypothetical protein
MEQIINITEELNEIDKNDSVVKLVYEYLKELKNNPEITRIPNIDIILNDTELKKFTDAFPKYL